MMKMIVGMGVYDQKSKEKIMKSVAGLPGIHMLYMDLKEGILIVIGEVDPVEIVIKLRKKWGKANLTLFVPYDARKEAKIAEAKENRDNREVSEREEALFRCNREIRNLHVPTPHYNIVNDQEQGCVIC